MKNVLIITPYYVANNRKDLKQDTMAVYYLCKNKHADENIIIVYYYQHTRFRALKQFFPLIFKTNNYKNYLYKDDIGNDVLLFEHPCIIPHRYKNISFFDKKNLKILNSYLQHKNIKLDNVVVHFPTSFWKFALKIKSIKKSMILHSFDVQQKKRLFEVVNYSKQADLIGFRSYWIKQLFQLRCPNSKSNQFLCLSGIPDEILTMDNNKNNNGKSKKLKLIFVGKLNKNKNVISVLKALSLLRNNIDFSYTIVGDGLEKQDLLRYVEQNDLSNNVTFTGKLQRSEIFELLNKNNVFIMTSLKETLGISYLEAMACKNIVIGSRGRGIDGLIVNEKNGYLVDPINIQEIANAILTIYNMNSKKIEKMKKLSYNTVANLSESKVSRTYLDNIFFKSERR